MIFEVLRFPQFCASLFSELEMLGVLARLNPSAKRWKQPNLPSQVFGLGSNSQPPFHLQFSVLETMLRKLSHERYQSLAVREDQESVLQYQDDEAAAGGGADRVMFGSNRASHFRQSTFLNIYGFAFILQSGEQRKCALLEL